MSESIETFVRKLQQDGIRAGIEAGEQERKKISSLAARILEDAKAEAERIIAAARETNRQERLKHEHELQLASRDMVLDLQNKLCAVVETIIARHAERVLDNTEELRSLIEQVAAPFVAEQSSHPNQVISIRISKEDASPVVRNALAQLTEKSRAKAPVFRVETGLDAFGFEYSHDGTTVELTTDSVGALLRNHVSAEVSQTVRAALEKETG